MFGPLCDGHGVGKRVGEGGGNEVEVGLERHTEIAQAGRGAHKRDGEAYDREGTTEGPGPRGGRGTERRTAAGGRVGKTTGDAGERGVPGTRQISNAEWGAEIGSAEEQRKGSSEMKVE